VDLGAEHVLATKKAVADAAAAAAEGAKVVVNYFPQQWCKKYAFSVTFNDMQTMEKGKWMNDVAVEFGMHTIVDKELGHNIYHGTCYVMSTFFSEKLRTVPLTAIKVLIVTKFDLSHTT
jgi:Ulp1 family protease